MLFYKSPKWFRDVTSLLYVPVIIKTVKTQVINILIFIYIIRVRRHLRIYIPILFQVFVSYLVNLQQQSTTILENHFMVVICKINLLLFKFLYIIHLKYILKDNNFRSNLRINLCVNHLGYPNNFMLISCFTAILRNCLRNSAVEYLASWDWLGTWKFKIAAFTHFSCYASGKRLRTYIINLLI